ncbi:MAG: hypothetical protein J0H00_13725 [Burkholderiales bacterium]|nr:hypothetical protein [Burkholderiales bacterium]OJX09275.1 MAG: hypothetical protein BGO72_20615 [Burkholderiales bacterium 70-64]
MTLAPEIADVEKRAYARGYSAGCRRARVEMDAKQRLAAANRAWDRVFLAVLPVAMAAEGWTIGDSPVHSGEDRIRLAELLADRAFNHLRGLP